MDFGASRQKGIGSGRLDSKEILGLFLIIFIGVGLRLAHLVYLLPVYNADEAVFGLMTKDLLEGRGFPIYFYGAHYAGTLSCYLAAVPFSLFGMTTLGIRLISFLFTLPTMLFVYLWARSMANRRVASLAALFFAIPPLPINELGQYQPAYPETFFFVTVTLFLTHRFLSKEMSPRQEIRTISLLGFLNGLGTWVFFSIVPSTLAAWTLIACKKLRSPFRRLLAFFLIFYAIGISPMVIYNIRYPFATFTRLGSRVLGGAMKSELSGKGIGDLTGLVLSKIGAILLGLPAALLQVVQNIWEMMRIAPSLGWFSDVWDFLSALMLGFLCVAIIFSQRKILVGMFRLRRSDLLQDPCLLPSVFVVWMVLFLAATGLTLMRYATFMYPVIAILLAWSISRFMPKKRLWIPLTVLFMTANLANHLMVIRGPKASLVDLLHFLEAKRLHYGYTDYFTAYPIVFLTDEKIIASPAAGPLNVERYPAYTERVDQAKGVFFVFERDSEASQRFEDSLKTRKVTFEKENVGQHVVYYDFSKRIYPNALPLIRFFPVVEGGSERMRHAS